MDIVDNTAVQFTASNNFASEIKAQIERSEIVKDNRHSKELLVFWDHSEMRTLATYLDKFLPSQNIPKIPSPMQRDYTWPGFYTPFAHQRDTAYFLSIRQRAFCFNEAGTGKTSAAVWAADYLMNKGIINKALIICPLSIMYSAWQADIMKTAIHRTCGVAHGSSAKRKKILDENFDFTIINYDGTTVILEELQKAKFDLIIVDEANAYKSPSTKRWKTLAKLIEPTTWLWLMTGTPAAQSPVDAFGLAKLISPGRVPKFSTAWRDRVMVSVSKFKWVPKHAATDEVFRALQPAIRYTKKECLDLPEVVYQTRDVPLTPQVQKFYNELKKQLLIEAAGEQISAVNAAASLNKLLQISGGAVYTDKHDIVQFDISPRLSALKEVLEETTNKVVVFVPFLHAIDIVGEYLTKEGVTNEVIKGSVAARERSEIIYRFQNSPDPRVLIIQPQSAAHGITLTAADTVVFWSPVMSVETYLQCIARIERVGQVNKMSVVHLRGSEVEKKIYDMLQGKVDSHQKLVDLYKQELEEVDDE
jgi:SNF2 family DNA or RNA helicase